MMSFLVGAIPAPGCGLIAAPGTSPYCGTIPNKHPHHMISPFFLANRIATTGSTNVTLAKFESGGPGVKDEMEPY